MSKQPFQPPPQLLGKAQAEYTITEAAQRLGCHPVTLYRMIQRGRFPEPIVEEKDRGVMGVRRRVRIRHEQLIAWHEEQLERREEEG